MEADAKIAVAGATGRVGRHVVEVLRERGYQVVPMSRSTGVDVVTGEGLAAALNGVSAIVDASTGASPDQAAATAFFTASATNLQQAGQRAGVQRIVLVSIIGIDRLTAGYNVAKLAQERLLLAGPVPVHVLRAAQFHEFVGQLVDWGRQGEVSYLPRMRTQLVAARTVAEALADLATVPEPQLPAERITEIAGPREESLVDAATLLMARRGDPVKIETGAHPAEPDAEQAAGGALLPGPGAVLAGPTFAEWLETAA